MAAHEEDEAAAQQLSSSAAQLKQKNGQTRAQARFGADSEAAGAQAAEPSALQTRRSTFLWWLMGRRATQWRHRDTESQDVETAPHQDRETAAGGVQKEVLELEQVAVEDFQSTQRQSVALELEEEGLGPPSPCEIQSRRQSSSSTEQDFVMTPRPDSNPPAPAHRSHFSVRRIHAGLNNGLNNPSLDDKGGATEYSTRRTSTNPAPLSPVFSRSKSFPSRPESLLSGDPPDSMSNWKFVAEANKCQFLLIWPSILGIAVTIGFRFQIMENWTKGLSSSRENGVPFLGVQFNHASLCDYENDSYYVWKRVLEAYPAIAVGVALALAVRFQVFWPEVGNQRLLFDIWCGLITVMTFTLMVLGEASLQIPPSWLENSTGFHFNYWLAFGQWLIICSYAAVASRSPGILLLNSTNLVSGIMIQYVWIWTNYVRSTEFGEKMIWLVCFHAARAVLASVQYIIMLGIARSSKNIDLSHGHLCFVMLHLISPFAVRDIQSGASTWMECVIMQVVTTAEEVVGLWLTSVTVNFKIASVVDQVPMLKELPIHSRQETDVPQDSLSAKAEDEESEESFQGLSEQISMHHCCFRVISSQVMEVVSVFMMLGPALAFRISTNPNAQTWEHREVIVNSIIILVGECVVADQVCLWAIAKYGGTKWFGQVSRENMVKYVYGPENRRNLYLFAACLAFANMLLVHMSMHLDYEIRTPWYPGVCPSVDPQGHHFLRSCKISDWDNIWNTTYCESCGELRPWGNGYPPTPSQPTFSQLPYQPFAVHCMCETFVPHSVSFSLLV